MNIIGKKLFETHAIRVADPSKPYWYTSGKIGPYFINTQFLYGCEKDANELLELINNLVAKPEKLIKQIENEVLTFFNTNILYQAVMEEFVSQLKEDKLFAEADIISGGERRDWFFSIITAKLTGKKHVYIFKDLSIYDETGKKMTDLNGKKVAHIADLITEASSYDRAWIPAIQNAGGTMTYTASVVDRCQGGKEYLTGKNVKCYSPVKIDNDFFESAVNEGVITSLQYKMIKAFTDNPDKYGIDFIKSNPQFLRDSLNSTDKGTKSKAERCINDDTYGINIKTLI